jgi:cyclopropane fatty-acyl-phospholipid synthase-like methyltransferase
MNGVSMNFENVIEYYLDKVRQYGATAQGMDWKDQETQYLRFAVISRYLDFSTSPTVLDIGCGAGEFLQFCRTNQLPVHYRGLDVVPEMVKITNQRFGSDVAEVGEPLKWTSNQQFDYVIASGTFNAKLKAEEEDWREYFHASLHCMFELARKAIVFNCMSCYVDYRYERLYYADPNELSALAVRHLSRRFIIDHSYPLYEMTMAVYKNA